MKLASAFFIGTSFLLTNPVYSQDEAKLKVDCMTTIHKCDLLVKSLDDQNALLLKQNKELEAQLKPQPDPLLFVAGGAVIGGGLVNGSSIGTGSAVVAGTALLIYYLVH